MRIFIHIGPDSASSLRMQRIFDAKRDRLAEKGILYPRSPGAKNHTRLFMAVTDPGHVDALRFNRGYITPEKQQVLRAEVQKSLAAEIAQSGAHTVILSANQLATCLIHDSELARLRALLAPLSDDIRIVSVIDEPARMLAGHYATQVMEGRGRDLSLELGLLDAPDWWDAALATRGEINPAIGQFGEIQGAVHWIDLKHLRDFWETTFGRGALSFFSADRSALAGEEATDILRRWFGIEGTIGKADPARPARPASAAWLCRARRFNDVILRLLEREGTPLPRPLWRKFLNEIKVGGPPIHAGSLHPVTCRFKADIAALVAEHPGLDPEHLKRDRKRRDWQEADPLYGFRATQYLMSYGWRIRQAAKEAQASKARDIAVMEQITSGATPGAAPLPADPQPDLTPCARSVLPPLAQQNFEKLRTSSFAPHNRLGYVNEDELAAAFAPAPPRSLPEGSTGNVIVACMKNEAPYILEWIAYHRAIGVDNFLIYTNDCSDGTDAILARLDAMGVVQHRDNDNWTGNSPQQHALNAAMKEPVVTNSDWIIHIDVDEFINIRCGNGTLADFFDRVPDATNVAMTWRLFGHNGVTRLSDRFVIEEFDACAPKYCPKPHTVWGFKTMFRNIGAYRKLSCHRPNKLNEAMQDKVRWVNGSGQDMTHEALKNGWRNSKKTIGYDLIQLNHYALRSAESFLIKRQRGRALHVDRSIGLNYWIRMDWSDFRDITIKRNVPRLRAEYDRLLQDKALESLHERGRDWHRDKARELHAIPEFQELYEQAIALRLTETERVAYALSLDMES